MYAQKKSSTGPRGQRFNNRPVATRLRFGLVMRKNMDFGSMGDVETALRMQGVALAPMSTGEASMMVGGVKLMPTASAEDITNGRVSGLVVPGGMDDVEGDASARELIQLARRQGLPVIAFGGGVALGADATGAVIHGEGAILSNDNIAPIADRAALEKVVSAL